MKRPNGTGTVVKLSGNRRRPFVVRVSGRNKYGALIQKALSYHATGREAQDALDQYNTQKAAGTAPAVDQLNYTVQDVYTAWSDREYAKLEKEERIASLRSHKAAWGKRVSRFAGRKMRDMTLDEWQSLLDEDEDNGLSQSSIKNDAILIRALYDYSMKRDIIGKDLSMYLEIPSVDPKNPKGALSDIQLASLSKMASEGVPWADTVLMLCYTGFRVTEFLTLTPFSFDAKNNTLCGGIKTDAGKNRIVPVHPVIKSYLLRHLSKGGETIICDDDGQPISSNRYRDTFFKPILEKLGETQATPHWCRHTFATRLHKAGVDKLTRQWLLGHSTKKDTTDGYTHASLEVLTAAIQKLA